MRNGFDFKGLALTEGGFVTVGDLYLGVFVDLKVSFTAARVCTVTAMKR